MLFFRIFKTLLFCSTNVTCLASRDKHSIPKDPEPANKSVLKILKNNILKIQSQSNCEIIENDVLHFLTTRKLGINFNLIFIDPPYQFKKVDEIFKLITNNFRSNIIIFHTHVKNKLILPNKLNILIDKTYGISRIMFLKN